jgi:hypothetical protein
MLSSVFLLHARGSDSIQPCPRILDQVMTSAWNAFRPGSAIGKYDATRHGTPEVWIFAVRGLGPVGAAGTVPHGSRKPPNSTMTRTSANFRRSFGHAVSAETDPASQAYPRDEHGPPAPFASRNAQRPRSIQSSGYMTLIASVELSSRCETLQSVRMSECFLCLPARLMRQPGAN